MATVSLSLEIYTVTVEGGEVLFTPKPRLHAEMTTTIQDNYTKDGDQLLSTSPTPDFSKLISDEVNVYLGFFLRVVLSGSISLPGIAVNCINVLVFSKQSFQESATISLFCLSICDLGVCITTFLYSLGYALVKLDLNLSIDINDLIYMTCALPRRYFSALSMCATVVLSLERCLCIIKPLTFRRIINKRTTLACLLLLFLEVTVNDSPVYRINSLTWQYDSSTNSTRLKLFKDRGPLAQTLFIINRVNVIAITVIAVPVVVVCTLIMAIGLNRAKKFKQAAIRTSLPKSDMTSGKDVFDKERRLAKTVILVSLIFLLCYLPLLTITVVGMLIPGLSYNGKYANINDFLWGIIYVLGAANATFNVFVYYKTSSKYKTIFNEIFFAKGAIG